MGEALKSETSVASSFCREERDFPADHIPAQPDRCLVSPFTLLLTFNGRKMVGRKISVGKALGQVTDTREGTLAECV